MGHEEESSHVTDTPLRSYLCSRCQRVLDGLGSGKNTTTELFRLISLRSSPCEICEVLYRAWVKVSPLLSNDDVEVFISCGPRSFLLWSQWSYGIYGAPVLSLYCTTGMLSSGATDCAPRLFCTATDLSYPWQIFPQKEEIARPESKECLAKALK
jgi:hypothetical protein